MNVVIMKGNLGADAEVKQVEGRVIVSFRMAVTERGFLPLKKGVKSLNGRIGSM